jgi:hypothetical protein
MKKTKPGRVDFTSEEIEWMYAHLHAACQTTQDLGLECNLKDNLHRCLDKLDLARFQDAVPLMVPRSYVITGAKAIVGSLSKKAKK